MLPDRASLRALVLRASWLTMTSHGASQAIRLARSLILTRLLFPEAFGVMALVWVVMYGLAMLSDTGTGPAIIRDKRGDDPDFLNTAWTIQVVRGATLWILACLVAYPMAAFYAEPMLVQLVPVAGLTAIVDGFRSTAMHTSRRHMRLGRLVLLEFCNELVGLVVTVLWAVLDPTIWALVGGALAGHLFVLVGSHTLLPGIRNRFRWDPASLAGLLGFGKWIYLSSAFHFLAVQGDRLLLGRYLTLAQLGVYSIAVMLIEAALALATKMISGVLFPAYAKAWQSDGSHLRSMFHRARLGIDVLFILPIAALMPLGPQLVALLYDARYHDAGWMFQVLCVRLLLAPVLANSEACLVALGRPQYGFGRSACRALWVLAGIPIGWSLAGTEGVVWAVALSEVPAFGLLLFGLARHNMLSLASELRSASFAGAGALLGLGLLRLLP